MMLFLALLPAACVGDSGSADTVTDTATVTVTDTEPTSEDSELESATQRWPRPLNTLDPDAPAHWDVEVLDRFPHDTHAFTQGLEALGDGTLLESTGLRGESTIRIVDPTTGVVLDTANLTEEEFDQWVDPSKMIGSL